MRGLNCMEHGAVRLKMWHAPMFSQQYSELLGALSLVDWKKSGTGKFKLFFPWV